MSIKEFSALLLRIVTEQSLGQLARIADFTINQVRDFARSTMIAHIVVQILAGIIAVSGVLALTLGWAIYVDPTLQGWQTAFFINCGLFAISIFLITFTLKRYSKKQNNFVDQSRNMTRRLTESLMTGYAHMQKEQSLHQQEARIENLEKSIELIAQALNEESRYFGPEVVPSPSKRSKERSSTNV